MLPLTVALFLQLSYVWCWSNASQGCFLVNNRTNEHWRLVWQDEFNSSQISKELWNVENETDQCHGNQDEKQVSCNVEHNIQTSAGNLVMMVKHEKYLERSFTGAAMTSRTAFRKGRYEIRASLPVGQQTCVCIFTVNQRERYWHENGEIDILYTTDEPLKVDRGVYFANSSEDRITPNQKLWVYTSLRQFNLYGVEWDEQELKFFFNDLYGVPVKFNATRGLNPFHQIRFELGVGSMRFRREWPKTFEKLHWKCPALIVDYVKVYEKLSNVSDSDGLERCLFSDQSEEQSRAIIDQICEQASRNMDRIGSKWTIANIWKETIIAFLLAFCSILAVQLYCHRRHVQKNIQIPFDDNEYSYPELEPSDRFVTTFRKPLVNVNLKNGKLEDNYVESNGTDTDKPHDYLYLTDK